MLPYIFLIFMTAYYSVCGHFINYYKLRKEIEEDITKPCSIKGHEYLSVLDRFELNHKLQKNGEANGCYYRSYIQLHTGDRVFYPDFLPLTTDNIKYTVNAPRTVKFTHYSLSKLPSHYEPSPFSKMFLSKPSAFRDSDPPIFPPLTRPKSFDSYDVVKTVILIDISIILFFLLHYGVFNKIQIKNIFRLKLPCFTRRCHSTSSQNFIGFKELMKSKLKKLKQSLFDCFHTKSAKKTKRSKFNKDLKPLQFTGNSSQVGIFLKQLDLLFEANPNHFETDSKKVIYAMFQLSPDVFEFIHDYILQTTTIIDCPYSVFQRTLTSFYSYPNSSEDIRYQIDQLYYCECQDILQFCREMVILCSKAGFSQIDTRDILIQRLPDELGDKEKQTSSDDTLEELVSKIGDFYNHCNYDKSHDAYCQSYQT